MNRESKFLTHLADCNQIQLYTQYKLQISIPVLNKLATFVIKAIEHILKNTYLLKLEI